MIVISTLLEISSSVRDIERLLRESPPFSQGGEDVKPILLASPRLEGERVHRLPANCQPR